jgi:SAM-dependent methyltransferase
VTLDDPWLASAWSFVSCHVPAPQASVLEIGCGSRGGFIPELIRLGYGAVGVDPNAPEGPAYRRVKFEDADVAQPVDAVVACTALHHVSDLDQIVDRIATTLLPDGMLVVVEWAWERFDEATARWCFLRLGPSDDEGHPGWLHRHHDRWQASGESWESFFQAWAADERLHPAERILDALDERFQPRVLTEGPYFFRDLHETSEADEQAAIDTGKIAASCLRYVATRR